ncbi:hypothetical protein BDQ17DRAFT_1336722 [Cyathus striatus]|nr:hypothetical protein BDQ17DRAFT_1336722 [Cyathus striatus]
MIWEEMLWLDLEEAGNDRAGDDAGGDDMAGDDVGGGDGGGGEVRTTTDGEKEVVVVGGDSGWQRLYAGRRWWWRVVEGGDGGWYGVSRGVMVEAGSRRKGGKSCGWKHYGWNRLNIAKWEMMWLDTSMAITIGFKVVAVILMRRKREELGEGLEDIHDHDIRRGYWRRKCGCNAYNMRLNQSNNWEDRDHGEDNDQRGGVRQ